MSGWWAFLPGEEDIAGKKMAPRGCGGCHRPEEEEPRGVTQLGGRGCRRVGSLSQSREATQGGVTVLGDGELSLL